MILYGINSVLNVRKLALHNMGPMDNHEDVATATQAVASKQHEMSFDLHEACNKQIERLKEHLIILDQEATDEAFRHQHDIDQLQTQIDQLRQQLLEKSQIDQVEMTELLESACLLREEVQQQKELIARLEMKARKDAEEIENLKACLEISNSRTSKFHAIT